jgi:cell wall-associated NlpC family hydrolase
VGFVKDRSAAIAIARSFLKTPYALGAHLKGAGVDCATLLGLYLIEIGAATEEIWVQAGLYSHDWFLHASRERYIEVLKKYAAPTWEGVCRSDSPALPGQIVTFKSAGSKKFNHGAIVTSWPRGIHAAIGGVREVNLAAHPLSAFKPMDVFDPFPPE